jgi:hypothetical protein
MTHARRRNLVVLILAAAVVLLTTGVAAAVSGGGYAPSQQDCAPNADSHAAGTKGQPANPVPSVMLSLKL